MQRVEPFCLSCGYDLAQLPHLRCPECGRLHLPPMFRLKRMQRAAKRANGRLMRMPLVFAAVAFGFAILCGLWQDLTEPLILLLLSIGFCALMVALEDARHYVSTTLLMADLRARRPLRRLRSMDGCLQLVTIVVVQGVVALALSFLFVPLGMMSGNLLKILLVSCFEHLLPQATLL